MCRFIIALHFPPDKQNLPFPVMLQSIFTYIFTNETFRGKPMKPSFSSRLKDFLQGAFSPVRLGLLLLIASYFAGTGIGWLSRHPSFFSFFPWNMESSVSSPADPSSTDTSSTDTPVSTGLTSLSCAIPSLTAPSEGNWGLSFQQDGQLPTGNATIESLKKYDAYYAKDTDEKVIFLTFDAGYENGNTPMLEMLLSASSFSDFLNRTEYISEINSYDRQKLEEFIQVQEQIAAEEASLEEQKKDLESEQQELLAMQDDMKVKQNSVNSLISSTQANISQTNSELSSAQGKVNDINSQIARMEELEKQLEIQKAKEDAARMAEIKRQEAENNGEFSYVPSDSDLYLLGAIIQCEADGEPYEGKLAVGSVVMNRVRSSYFPNTVSGVIYQSGQFSPVASGRYALRLEQGVNNTCMQAAQEVLNGNITNSCLYFRTVIDGLEGTIIGHHIFY